MHNPLALLSKELLDGMIAQGNMYFVRQPYPRGIDHFANNLKGVYLFTHYTDREKAEKHVKLISEAELYDARQEEDIQRLYKAASQPPGYLVFSALLKAKKWEPSVQLAPKIKHYLRAKTTWKPEKGQTIRVDLSIQFGELFLKLKNGADELKVPLSDIERF